jgi:hypothetical protein
MAKATFPIVRTQRTLPGRSTAVRANIPTDTGQGLIGEAVASVGGAVSDLGVKFDLIQARSQLSESTVAASDIENAFFLELQGNNDPETYGESMEKLFADIDTLAPKNEKAAAMYNQQMAGRKLAIAKKTREGAQDKVISNAQSADFLLLQKAKETGDFIPYKASIINGVKLGVYTAKEGEALLDDADIEAVESNKNAVLSQALEQVDSEGEFDPNLAEKIIEESELDADQKIDLFNQTKNIAESRMAKLKRVGQEAIVNQTVAFDEALSNDKLTHGLVESWDISLLPKSVQAEALTQKKLWRSVVDAQAKDALSRVTTPKALAAAEDAITSLRRGAMPLEVYRNIINTNMPELSQSAYEDYLKSGRRDFQASQNDSLESNRPLMKSILFPGGEDNMFSLNEQVQEARKQGLGDKVNSLNAKVKIQRMREWNYRVASRMLDDFVTAKPTATSDEIQAESDRITASRTWTLSKLMKEHEKSFKNTQQSILVKSPFPEMQSRWVGLSDNRKIKVLEMIDNGANPDLVKRFMQNTGGAK